MPASPSTDSNRSMLFVISLMALFTAAMVFSLRVAASGAIKEALYDPVDIANSGRMIGDALGAAFLGFAGSLLIASPLLDIVGVKRVFVLSSLCYITGALIIVAAPVMASGADVVPLVWWGMLVSGVGWGCTEAAINPLTAAIYPDEKTHRMNVLHAWWPAGVIIGGLLSLLLFQMFDLDWRVAIVVPILPAVVFGVLALRQRFPTTIEPAHDRSYGDMLLVVLRRPTFWIFFCIMFLTASCELAPASWVDVALSETVKMPGVVVLVYVAAIMFVMRHFAGALAHRLSDIGLLWAATIPTGIGLFLLSTADSPLTALVAATAWAIGVCYLWPTMLAAVAQRYPQGGPWAIGLTAFAGAMAIRYVLPQLGAIYDRSKFEAAGGAEAFAALAPESAQMGEVMAHAATVSFRTIALIPVALFVIFGVVWLIEKRRGRPLG
ncbi:MAG: sugar MFS transporter [Gammaproteobacteria bacterium]